MNQKEFENVVIDCAGCPDQFVWTPGEQSFFARLNLAKPRRCPRCRTARASRRERLADLQYQRERIATGQVVTLPDLALAIGVLNGVRAVMSADAAALQKRLDWMAPRAGDEQSSEPLGTKALDSLLKERQ